jgi:predicted amidohydrolase YtcJ
MERIAARRAAIWLTGLLTVWLVGGCERSAAPPSQGAPPAADGVTLFLDARIYTFDAAGTVFEAGALAVSANGELLAVGEEADLLPRFAEARHVGLGGKAVLPGLIDSHGHLHGLALSLTRVNLAGAESKDDVLERLKEFADDLSPGAWLLGRGWDQNDWPVRQFPDRSDLDRAFPDRPVWLRRIDGHAAWANSLAIAQADMDLTGTWQPEGGWIHRDAAGVPTGIFIDAAMTFVERAVPPTADDVLESALDAATGLLVRLGLTGVHDPGVSREVIRLYRSKIEAGALPLRVYAMAEGTDEMLQWLCDGGPLDDPSGRLVVRSVKLYADGALGSRGAALIEDYRDEAGNRGLMFSSPERLESDMRGVASCGLQVAVHAIGDRANRQVLDVFEKSAGAFPNNPGRHRIEHAQVLHPGDISRFAGLGVIASMQPTHATSDMYWANERLGPDRLEGAYAWASLVDSGAMLAFGSDFPVEEVNPMLGIYAAVTRKDLAGQPADGWLREQAVGRETAVRAFTTWAAHAAFMEDRIGSLEAGKRADFIVLDRDLMQVPVEEIPKVTVEQTWVDGVRVHPH